MISFYQPYLEPEIKYQRHIYTFCSDFKPNLKLRYFEFDLFLLDIANSTSRKSKKEKSFIKEKIKDLLKELFLSRHKSQSSSTISFNDETLKEYAEIFYDRYLILLEALEFNIEELSEPTIQINHFTSE